MSAVIAMKRQHTDLDGGILAQHTPKALVNQKIAYMLYTGMVKDKDAYPARELSKNAQEVSPPGKPPHIHLPTFIDPTFRVRDFGPGLSYHFMMHKYTQIGYSTKDANGVNGMSGWGAGSKSPFAKLFEDGMNGSYNVTSYQRGVVRHYVISLDANGMPQSKLLAEDTTTEPDGLEVSFAVPNRDISRFSETARQVLWSFEPRPVITPRPDAQWLSGGTVADKGDGWTRYDRDTVPFHGPQVRVDRCVMYPIDIDQIDGVSGVVSSDDAIIFEVSADSVQATASRESLQYTSSTKATLKGIIETYELGLVDHMNAQIAAEGDYFSACAKAQEMMRGYGSFRRINLLHKISWRNRRVETGLFPYRAVLLGADWSISSDSMKFKKEDWEYRTLAGHLIVVQWSNDRNVERFRASGLEGMPILWVRLKKRGLAGFLDQYDLTLDDVYLLDSINLPELPKTTKSMIRQREKFVYTNGRLDVRMQPVDLANGGYYIRKVRNHYRSRSFSYEINGRTVGEHALHEAIRVAIKVGVLSDQDNIIIQRKDDRLGDNWTHLGQKLITGLTEKFDPALVKVGSEAYHCLERVLRHLIDIEGVNNIPDDIMDLINRGKVLKSSVLSQEETDNVEIQKVLANLNAPVAVNKQSDPVDALSDRFEDLKKKYKLLSCITNNWGYYGLSEGQKETLQHYFDLCAAYHNETGVVSS